MKEGTSKCGDDLTKAFRLLLVCGILRIKNGPRSVGRLIRCCVRGLNPSA